MPSNELVGLLAVSGAVVLFGSFAAPVKASKTGDGIFFQWIMCCAIFAVGIIYNFALCSSEGQCPTVVPFASIGGAIWCISNILLVPLVDTIGLGLTLFCWGIYESLAGWVPARFGLGLNKEAVTNDALNYGGIVLTFCSLVVLFFVKPSTVEQTAAEAAGRTHQHEHAEEKIATAAIAGLEEGLSDESSDTLRHRLVNAPAVTASVALNNRAEKAEPQAAEEAEEKWTDKLSPTQKRIFGAVGCLVAGSLSGSTFTPAQHVIDAQTNWINNANHTGPAPYPNASLQLSDYVLSHFAGIWLCSTCCLALYLLYKRRDVVWRWIRRTFCRRRATNLPSVKSINGGAEQEEGDASSLSSSQPEIYPEEIPAYALSGLIWGVAMLCWFSANANLSIVVSFPLVTLGPGIVSVLWGVLLWREIEGKRNLSLVLAATLVYIAGAVCIVLSKNTSGGS
jgi:Transmembrane family, TMEM144 of transporters